MLCETDEILKDLFKNLLVSVVSLMLAGKEFQAAGPAKAIAS